MKARARQVELIYDADCPNVAATRSLLIKAFTRTGVSARWREWERSSADCPEYARHYGSPTVLVNGRDVADSTTVTSSAACRVYSDDKGGLSRTPPFDAICSALLADSRERQTSGRWQTIAGSFPAVGVALLPKLTCPLCFPAYAAILGAIGVEFINYTPYLLPLTAIFLVIAVAVLARQSRRTGNIAPLTLGVAAAVLVLAGKFYAQSDWIANGGIVLLVTAVFFSSRMNSMATKACPACAVSGNGESMQAR